MEFLTLALFVAVAVAAPAPDANGDRVELVVNDVAEGHPLDIGNIVGIQLKDHADGVVASTVDLLHPYSSDGIAEAAEAIAAAAEAAASESVIVPSPVSVVDSQPDVQLIPEPIVLPEAPSVVIETEIDDVALSPVAPIVMPSPDKPEVAPSPIVLPAPVKPEVAPSPIALPAPVEAEVAPSPIILPAPVKPEVAPSPIVLPAPVKPEVAPSPIVLPAPVKPEVAPSPVVLPAPAEHEPLPVPAPQLPSGEIFNGGGVEVQLNHPADVGVFSTMQSWFNLIVNYINDGINTG